MVLGNSEKVPGIVEMWVGGGHGALGGVLQSKIVDPEGNASDRCEIIVSGLCSRRLS